MKGLKTAIITYMAPAGSSMQGRPIIMVPCLCGYILAQQVLHYTHISISSCDVELWREPIILFSIILSNTSALAITILRLGRSRKKHI